MYSLCVCGVLPEMASGLVILYIVLELLYYMYIIVIILYKCYSIYVIYRY